LTSESDFKMRLLNRVVFSVLAFCFLQCIGYIGSTCASAQSISQLLIESDNDLVYFGSGLQAGNNKSTASTCKDILVQLGQFPTESCHASIDNSDYFSRIEKNNWCSAYALYRYTLEVNGIDVVPVPNWERRLRRYCSSETEVWDGCNEKPGWEDSSQGQSDYRDWGADSSVIFIPKREAFQIAFVDLEDREIFRAVDDIQRRNNFGWDGLFSTLEANRGVPIRSHRLEIGHDVKCSHYIAIGVGDESSAMHDRCVNLHDRFGEQFTDSAVSEWFRGLLAMCRNRGDDYNNHSEATHTRSFAGEAH
jgi:hypothetical protein